MVFLEKVPLHSGLSLLIVRSIVVWVTFISSKAKLNSLLLFRLLSEVELEFCLSAAYLTQDY